MIQIFTLFYFLFNNFLMKKLIKLYKVFKVRLQEILYSMIKDKET